MTFNVNTYSVGGSCTGASMAKAKAPEVQETYARRLIAKNLKIVTGTLVWSASTVPGSAGQTLDYRLWGDRFLWIGLTQRPLKTPTASGAELMLAGLCYDPVARKIYVASNVNGAATDTLKAITKNNEPGANKKACIGFCLLVADSGATSAGVGI